MNTIIWFDFNMLNEVQIAISHGMNFRISYLLSYRLLPQNDRHSCLTLTLVYILKYENGEILIRNSKLFKFIQSGPLLGIFIWS